MPLSIVKSGSCKKFLEVWRQYNSLLALQHCARCNPDCMLLICRKQGLEMSQKWVAGASLNSAYSKSMDIQQKMIAAQEVRACFAAAIPVSMLQVGQISSDAWEKKAINNSQKMINICVNLPDGQSAFSSIHPTTGRAKSELCVSERSYA